MGAKWRLAVAAAAMFALTACGSNGGDGNDVASLNGDQKPSGQGEPQNAGSDEDQMRAFAKCMRDNGVDMPDPEPGGAGGLSMRAVGAEDAEKMNKAGEACNKLLPNGGKPKPLSPEELDKMRTQAKCMREHGIDMPDPDPNNPGITIGGPGDDPGKMEKAMKECGMGVEGGAIAVAPQGGGK